MAREYQVATFIEPGTHTVRAYVQRFGYWWDGLVIYDVEADSTEEAKRMARKLRLEHERTRAVTA